MNPIYYKIDGSTNIEILVKENEVSLKHDDQFGFLPDKCWFKISIKKSRLGTDNVEAASLMLRVRAVAELNDSQNFPEIIPQVGNNQQVEAASQAEVTSQNVIILPTPDFTFQVKREAEEANQAEEKSPKRQRTENPTSSSSISGNVEQQVPCQSSVSVSRFKTCFFFQVFMQNFTLQTNVDQPTSSTTIVKKEEPDSTDNLRASCEFGIRCYRKTIEHRRESAHPGDSDYRRPNFPPAPPGSPMCPYGPSCYRRNPDHFQEFAHPASSIYLCLLSFL